MENETQEKQKRPILVTIICWFMIIGVVMAPYLIYMAITNPDYAEIMAKGSSLPVNAQIALMAVGAVITLVSAIGMLKGKMKARTVYTIYTIVAYSITFAASHMKESLVGSLIITLVILGLLYIPAATRYFKANNA